MTLSPGTKLGPYEILAQIGAGGGMGEVWKARETRLGRIVAIKCQLHDIGPDYLALEYVVWDWPSNSHEFHEFHEFCEPFSFNSCNSWRGFFRGDRVQYRGKRSGFFEQDL